MTRSIVQASLLLSLFALPLSASAQPAVQLDAYRAAELPTDGFATARPVDLDHLRAAAQVTTDYALHPLVVSVRDASGRHDLTIVRHQLALNAGFALGLFNRVVVFAGLPLNAVQSGASSATLPKADGALVSDPWFGARVRLLGEAYQRFALGAQLTGTLPLADSVRANQRYTGEVGGTITPKLLGEVRFEHGLSWTLDIGGRFRPRDKAHVLPDLPVSQDFLWATALSECLLPAEKASDPARLAAYVELFGRNTFGHFASRALSDLEGLLGLRGQPYLGWFAGAAVGAGLVRGYGAPDVRVIANLGWSSGRARPWPASAQPPKPVVLPPAAPEPAREPAPIIVAEPQPAPVVVAQPEPAAKPPEPAPEPTPVPSAPVVAASEPVRTLPPDLSAPLGFDPAKDRLDQNALTTLEGLAALLLAHPETDVQLEGHADPVGKAEDNRALSARRAQAVRDAFVAKGIAPERLELAACGESHPLHPPRAGTPVNNRRVELRIVPRGTPARAGCKIMPP